MIEESRADIRQEEMMGGKEQSDPGIADRIC